MSEILAPEDEQSKREGVDQLETPKTRKVDKQDQNHRDLAELKMVAADIEYSPKYRSDGRKFLSPHPSWRAQLAKKGLLVKRNLGSGSYSKVKLVQNVANNMVSTEFVAVKIIDRIKASKDYLRVFLPREVKIWPKLQHPNIIKIHSIFRDSWKIFMVMEHAERGDALSYVQKCGLVPENKAKEWMAQVIVLLCNS